VQVRSFAALSRVRAKDRITLTKDLGIGNRFNVSFHKSARLDLSNFTVPESGEEGDHGKWHRRKHPGLTLQGRWFASGSQVSGLLGRY
jgi:hypothetical protein